VEILDKGSIEKQCLNINLKGSNDNIMKDHSKSCREKNYKWILFYKFQKIEHSVVCDYEYMQSVRRDALDNYLSHNIF